MSIPTAYPHFTRFVYNPDSAHVGHLNLMLKYFRNYMSSLFVHSYNYCLNYLN